MGLIYGPSGCGKSSLVKAGLLPRLGKHVFTVYVEATAEETEARLLKGLHKACPELARGLGLVDSMANLRRGRILAPERKVLLVLDQFEQWLHAKRGEENTVLVAALRQCDGEHLQAVVLVRDDFWMAATRFLDSLEVELIKGQNTAAVDLFDPRHARIVLAAFGTAYGNLPERTGDISKEQDGFLNQAIVGLTQDGKIISVRLALFAEMVKGKPWTPATLRDVGGTEGVGVTFLEETFSSPQANPKHRLHQKAAQAVLKALLPEAGTSIRGRIRSEGDLQTDSGYTHRPRDHADLIHILDGELRLITPTEPEGGSDDCPGSEGEARYYQLTHDYLVPSLRGWLTRKQRQTRRGRAELRLAEASQSWGVHPRSQNLPSFSEWLSIVALTKSDKWSPLERRMVRAATRKHRAGLLSSLLFIALSCGIPYGIYEYINATIFVEKLNMATGQAFFRSAELIQDMPSSGLSRLFLRFILQQKITSAQKRNDTKMIARCSAVLAPIDPEKLTYMYSCLLLDRREEASPFEARWKNYAPLYENVIADDILFKYDRTYIGKLADLCHDSSIRISKRYFFITRLMAYDPLNANWDVIASDTFTHHEFSNDPDLSFSAVGMDRRLDDRMKTVFRKHLLKKIEQSRESKCPGPLLMDVLPLAEVLTVVAEGYLSGKFSLNDFQDNRFVYVMLSPPQLRDFIRFFERATADCQRERRRQEILAWMKRDPWTRQLLSPP